MIRVFKIGGNVVDNEEALKSFCKEFAAIQGPKILVHGGGVLASEMQKKLGFVPQMVEGRRVTDEQTLKIVTMVYAGWCNKHICALLQAEGCNAIGLSGCDASVIKAKRRAPKKLMDGVTEVDYGYVGDVSKESINVSTINSFIDNGFVPVFCAINHNGEGDLLNTNADTIAQSLASATGGELNCCFELPGVLKNVDDPDTLIPVMDSETFEQMKKDGTIAGGMIPKIENCLTALRNGAASAFIRSSKGIEKAVGTEVCL